ncbi:MAG: hypothetical protein HKN92_04830 [Chitinophagales bacterium]|nr:hypothetical protein [Chitinophagales bacterium]
MNSLLATILIIILSSSKYAAGIGLALLSDQSIIVSYLANIIGGLIGIVVFIYFGSIIKSFITKYLVKERKIFSWKSRKLVRLRTLGLTSVAFLTPVILSIPLGILVSLSLTSDKKKIFIAMMVSCVFWTSLFFILYNAFGLDLDKMIHSIF